ELDIKYKRPILYGMTPVVRIVYRPTEAAKIVFDYEIVDAETGTVFATAHSVQVFMDMNYNLMWDNPDFFVEWKKQWGIQHG
ncbi:MAG: acyl-CoA thioesterase, partial [Bacteroidaceae bacterium]|nr:acyl-CoA thioesterase [Bacteroidaceae bacterium]